MGSFDRTTPPVPGLPMPAGLRRFFRTEQAGGVVLLVGALAALIWANSPWQASYSSFWSTAVSLRVGGATLHADLRHAVNDGLMALFFFVVALEVKRELVAGELRSWRTASLPAVAALGGMVVPALLYTAVNVGGPGTRGWGVPMATDIAFAVGVLSLLGDRVPASLKLFLLSLAVVDDIGAILVIAAFYSESVDATAVVVATGLLGGVVVLRGLGVTWVPAYAVMGAAVWLAVFQSGVHATIAGAVLGLLTPARPLTPDTTVSVAERLEDALHPTVSFAVLPLFALANAGVTLGRDVLDAPGAGRVAVGIVVGLIAGKTLGILSFSWLAVRSGLSALPSGTTWGQVAGVAVTAGIGFTVSLFIAELAFTTGPLQAAAKVGILAASALAALLGLAILRRSTLARPATTSSS
ncbi:MAG: Na+/H+ antiporter NhaA [Acidimicrobiales bacterium]